MMFTKFVCDKCGAETFKILKRKIIRNGMVRGEEMKIVCAECGSEEVYL